MWKAIFWVWRIVCLSHSLAWPVPSNQRGYIGCLFLSGLGRHRVQADNAIMLYKISRVHVSAGEKEKTRASVCVCVHWRTDTRTHTVIQMEPVNISKPEI